LLSPYENNGIDLTNMYAQPSVEHWFGCDVMGRDILTRLLYGGRYSLILGLTTAAVSSFISILIGCIAGYFGGVTETLIMRFMDVWSALPGMLLAIMVSAVMGAGFFATVFALTIGAIAGGVRMTRGQVLAERKKEYIEAAESINCSKLSIMFRHLLPNVVQPMIIIATMNIGATIMMAAGLSYIGLGIQPPTPEWGAMLADGRAYIRLYPHMITFPGIAIALTVLAVNLIGDGLRDALDPKLRD
jgi:ABC-type dipeptide/oligopeptide/nickel transport system permease subunit